MFDVNLFSPFQGNHVVDLLKSIFIKENISSNLSVDCENESRCLAFPFLK